MLVMGGIVNTRSVDKPKKIQDIALPFLLITPVAYKIPAIGW
jgi:hypothetical protein